ncbi:hypothetical protein DC31_08425 [Microbacterium sp. CH12i]|uniref:hypothetical protein n=1 Tax=Microbacterium sp. CH12i TaxID=1479651 RepID=UPI0004618ADA|nr:hypothetical protein [Microbacterium sp. CH12i]KDA06451.1 hypothetical protein DC31_08425 [Microbacterium sp. CH12i]
MKKWAIRAVSLYVFNVAVLLLIGLLMSSVQVGWNALWASVILTLATLALKPTLLKVFRGSAAKSAASRTKIGEKIVQYVLVFIVELIIWVITVLLSGVNVHGWFWGYVLPPVYLLIAWVIYDLIDDRLEAKTGELIGSVGSKLPRAGAAESDLPSPAVATGRDELKDGLTPEQRRMLDGL